jgi:hypothetical protein
MQRLFVIKRLLLISIVGGAACVFAGSAASTSVDFVHFLQARFHSSNSPNQM